MSLAVSLGVLTDPDPDPDSLEWLRRDFREINRVLAENGLPPHIEPEVLPDFPYRGQLISFPYSWVHYLRRALAFARQAPDQFCPVPEGEKPAKHKRIVDELSIYLDSHFICHSDCEGFYVPIDFPEPLFDSQDKGLVGGILGSSQQALKEIIQVAPLLGISLDNGNLSDESAKLLAEEPDESHPYWIERKVWLTMFEAFRHSIEYQCAVIFG